MSGHHYTKRTLVVLGVAVAVLLTIVGGAVTQAQSARSKAAGDAQGRERFDIVGESRPGPVQVTVQDTVFPYRSLIVTTPPRGALPSSAVHVYEDGQAVTGVSMNSAGTSSARDRYVLSYVSGVPKGEREVELSVVVDGVGVRDVDYSAAPARSAVAAGGGHSFWTPAHGLIVAAVLAALLLALGILALVVPRQRRGELRRRVAQYTAPVSNGPEETPEAPQSHALPALERALQRLSWWPRFKTDVEIARFGRPAVELVALTALIAAVAAAVLGVAAGSVAVSVIVLPFGALALHLLVRQRLRKQQERFSQQLAAHLEELASALRAGHGLAAAVTVTAQSAAEPSRGEWSRVVADERLGKPLDEALRVMATRMECSEIEQVAVVASLHQRTGGNMAEVLERVADGVRERSDLERELKALTAQARLSGWVISALPPVLIVVITALNHNYMRPLFTTTGGIVMLSIGSGLLITGTLVIRRLTNIKV